MPGSTRAEGAAAVELITETLDPVLVPLEFAPGQPGTDAWRGQVIYCRGRVDSEDDGCVDLVLDLEASPEWRVVDVRYWGFTSDRWHLKFDRDAALAEQVAGLAKTLPSQLTSA